ncbi:MAG: T9SS type A sorting domain-containing protein [Paludibacteraceae bacterium]|nr:T9SS type A sorting domain-containing protein [Paludibacteraceae bacterium]
MKKFLLLFVVLVLSIGLWATTQTVTYRYPVYNTPGDPASGIASWTTGSAVATVVEDTTTTLNAGWYVVTGTNVQTGTLTCTGAVNLILADGAKLTASGESLNAGIMVLGNGDSFTIYAQSTDIAQMGKLFATGGGYGAGIGGGYEGSGSGITINGGSVTAKGGHEAAGIGGGYHGSGSGITINGGSVTATGGETGTGIGGGFKGVGSDITINGGSVTATGGETGAGIGGGSDGAGSDITINGGTVTANGGEYGAGIGGGFEGSGLDIAINGGTVIATGGENGAGIGGGSDGAGSDITINGGTVTANGEYDGAGIGGGVLGHGFDITINGGTVTANSGTWGAGIGGGRFGNGSDITINGGSVTATGGYYYGAGIGGGSDGSASDIFVSTILRVKADNNNPPTTVILNTGSDLASSLASERYVKIETRTTGIISANVNDETMGSVTGAGEYLIGDEVSLTAIPTDHHHFVNWDNGSTDNPLTFIVDMDFTVTANFAIDQQEAIDYTEADSYAAYAENNEIVVTGAADHTVAVYDTNGRLVKAIENAADIEHINVNVAGVYVIRVSNMTATRVVVK